MALALVAALAVPAWAQCDDCPMHKKGEGQAASAEPAYLMVLGVTGADTADGRLAVARGLEFVLDLPAESLTLGEDGKLALPVGGKRIVKLSEIAAALEKIAAGVKEHIPGAKFAIDQDSVTFTGPVRLFMKGLRCEGCVARLKKTYSSIDAAVSVRLCEEGTGMVGLAVTGLSLAEIKKPLEGTHFTICDAEMGSPGCPHPDCDQMMNCPHKGKAEAPQGEGSSPHQGAAEGHEGGCPHMKKAGEEKDGCHEEGAEGEAQKPGCCKKGEAQEQ